MNQTISLRNLEKEIWKACIPYLEKGRRGDIGHTERTIFYGKKLLQNQNNADYSIVVPSLIGHDTGYSKLFEKYETCHNLSELKHILPFPEIEWLHMKYGKEIMERVLDETNYTKMFGTQKSQKVTKIVSMHDYPRTVFDWGDIDAIVVVEADRLDRYDLRRMPSYIDSFPEQPHSWGVAWLENGLKDWFVTQYATSLAKELFDKWVETLRKQGEI